MRPLRRALPFIVLAALLAWLLARVMRTDAPPERATVEAQAADAREHAPEPPSDAKKPAVQAVPMAPRTSALTGLVVASDGSPVEGAQLVLVGSSAVRAGSSQADGHFRIDGLAAGTWEIRATKDGLASAPQLVPLDGVRDRPDLKLVLEPGATLVGTVRDALDGLSVGSCVVATKASEVACDRGGRFTIGPLSPGEVQLRITSPGYAPREVSARLVKRDRAFVDVLLSKGAVVRGIVRGPEKKPFSGARVTTRHYALGAREAAESATVSGADGRFTLDGVAPGRVSIVGAASGFAEASAEISIEAGATREGVELDLSTGGAVAGTVEAANGAPVAGAAVEALRTSDGGRAGGDTSAADGSFRIDGLSPGSYTLLASIGSARAMASNVAVQERDEAAVKLTLGDDAVLGVVHDPAGKPVSQALVTAYSSHALASGGSIAVTGPDGRFRIEGLVGAPYRVEAQAPGLGSAEARGVEAGAEVELVLAATGKLVVHVQSPTGAAADDVTIAIVPDGAVDGALADRHVRTQLLAADGTLARDLPAGAYVVRALSAASGRATASVQVQAGATTETSLELPAGASASGRVTTPNGPGAGCRVFAAPLEDAFPGAPMGTRETLSDDAGSFQLGAISPGAVLVKAICPDGTTGWQRLEASPGGRDDVQLRTVRTNHRETGDFGGIGASLGKGPAGAVVVTAVAEGGPAFVAGVGPGDVLVAVDGWKTEGAELNAVVERVRGPEGTPVQLDLLRPDGRPWRTVAERARIVVP